MALMPIICFGQINFKLNGNGCSPSSRLRQLEDKQNYQVGDRIGQLIIIPYPYVEFVESDELSDSERGTGGYGSSWM